MLNIYQMIRIQLPIGTPNPDDNKPLDLSDPFEFIVFIIVPIVVFILYLLWKRKKNNNK
ncbi:adenylosuccinate synthetase [Polaribacter sp.]|uniref:adenylosuccinate synthetase n=1 Tax=Polaribacter sp. TaxID=1920175 RepID=UPI003F6D0DA0